MSSGLTITIFDTHVRVPNGTGSFKNISRGDFIEEVKRMETNEPARATAGTAFRFPNEVLTAEVSPAQCRLLMYFPAAKRTVKHIASGSRHAKAYEIPFPATLIHVTMTADAAGRWVLQQPRWYCTDMNIDEVPSIRGLDFTPQNRIWALPFPNQYGDGRMCVGQNNYKSLYSNDLRGMNELFYGVLIDSAFNDDLGVRINLSINPNKWFEKLSKLDEFPFKYLSGYVGRSTVAIEEEDEEEENED